MVMRQSVEWCGVVEHCEKIDSLSMLGVGLNASQPGLVLHYTFVWNFKLTFLLTTDADTTQVFMIFGSSKYFP